MMEEVSSRKLGSLDLILATLKGSIGFHVAIQNTLLNETCTNKQRHEPEEYCTKDERLLLFELATNKEVDE